MFIGFVRWFEDFETAMTTRTNVLRFLIGRFLLLTAMVLGFSYFILSTR